MNAVSTLEQVKQHLVHLKLVAALEVLDSVLDQVERQQISTLDAYFTGRLPPISRESCHPPGR